ncbi:hypothetical protein [Thiothrix sp.]|jgi:hypothetical protein|uniref:hypothetical protein n=1 Tax=Thiothrix sp. TaxID=1032 RepID=UPI00257C0624|nr:hypothetical protein [Thiothrix sp.]
MRNKIALFEFTPRSAVAWLILAVTGCPLTHAAVQVDGVWYDSSETRGTFDRADLSRLAGRPCQVCEFDGNLSGWLRDMRGKRYDYRGVAGWLICRFTGRGCGDMNKFYCFESALSALSAAGHARAVSGAITGCHVRRALPGAPRYKIFDGG